MYEGKDRCLILDHTDSHTRPGTGLGFVTDIAFDELDDGKPKKKDSAADAEERIPLPKECQECSVLIPARMMECPSCGAAVKRPTNVQQQDGELTELVPGSKREKPKPVHQRLKGMGEASIIGQLYTLRDERGKSDGWVLANFKSVFGKFPKHLDQAPPQEPTYELVSWIKSRSIAYAKAMEAKRRAGGEVVL